LINEYIKARDVQDQKLETYRGQESETKESKKIKKR